MIANCSGLAAHTPKADRIARGGALAIARHSLRSGSAATAGGISKPRRRRQRGSQHGKTCLRTGRLSRLYRLILAGVTMSNARKAYIAICFVGAGDTLHAKHVLEITAAIDLGLAVTEMLPRRVRPRIRA